jgi:HEAT repeat protein
MRRRRIALLLGPLAAVAAGGGALAYWAWRPGAVEESVQVALEAAGEQGQREALRAVRSLGSAGGRRNRLALEKILAESPSGQIRGEAAAELGRFKDLQTGVLIRALREDPSAQARAGAAVGLRRRRDPAAVADLLEALSDRDRNVRLQAIAAISDITALWFSYRAEVPPPGQSRQIQEIREILHDRGIL